MIQPGDLAPDFELPDAEGQPVRLSSLRGRSVVLYFYPADHTMGCTLQTRAFVRRMPEIAAKGATIIGVSSQTAESHKEFASSCGIPTGEGFRLLVDRRREAMKLFGVLGRHNLAERVTFVIGPDGVVRDVYASELLWTRHASRALLALDG